MNQVLATPTDQFQVGLNGPKKSDAAAVPAPRPAGSVGDECTDLGNAKRLVELHSNDLRYCHPWKQWLVWDRKRWRADDTGEVTRRAKETARTIAREAAVETDPDKSRRRLNHASKTMSAGRIEAMIRLAASEPGVYVLPGQLDADTMLLNAENGTIDLRTGTLRPHDRSDLITKLCPTHFDPAVPCPAFEGFLAKVFPATGDAAEETGDVALIAFLQRLLGYCVTGDVREHVMCVFYGDGANGKSTLINTVLQVLGRDYSFPATPELLMASRGDRHPTELTDLFGRRLVAAAESRQGARLDEETVKQLTGGDVVKGRRMKQDFWEFEPTHKLILQTNHKPKVVGEDNAIWRRIRLVPFAVRFWNPDVPARLDEDRQEGLKQDKGLGEKLRAEASGVLAWMVRGCLEWQAKGLGMPAAVAEATQGYRNENDQVSQFLAECCVTGQPHYNVKAVELYHAFRKYLEDGGERQIPSQREFARSLTRRGVERYTNNGSRYRGLALASRGGP